MLLELHCLYFCRIFEDLLSISSTDPILLPQLVFICPKKNLNFLFLRIPVAMSSAFINKVLLDPQQQQRGRSKCLNYNVSFLSF